MIKKLILLMVASVLLVILGTFLYFREYQNLPEFAVPLLSEAKIPSAGDKVIVFAPHPDDETLATGGLIAKALQNGAEVKVVIVTNGDSYLFSTMRDYKKVHPNSEDYTQEGYRREEESKKALKILGLDGANIYFLGYPDMGLKKLLGNFYQSPYQSPTTKLSQTSYSTSYHQDVAYTGENLQADITDIIKNFSPTMVFASSSLDIHPDHAATGIFIQKSIDSLGENKPKLYFYLVHFRHFPSPKGLHKDRYLTPPVKLISLSNEIFKISLDKTTLDLKERALQEYQSQLKVPFLKRTMDCFLRQNELLFTSS